MSRLPEDLLKLLLLNRSDVKTGMCSRWTWRQYEASMKKRLAMRDVSYAFGYWRRKTKRKKVIEIIRRRYPLLSDIDIASMSREATTVPWPMSPLITVDCHVRNLNMIGNRTSFLQVPRPINVITGFDVRLRFGKRPGPVHATCKVVCGGSWVVTSVRCAVINDTIHALLPTSAFAVPCEGLVVKVYVPDARDTWVIVEATALGGVVDDRVLSRIHESRKRMSAQEKRSSAR